MVTDQQKCERVVGILKAVAHPIRLRIVASLCQGDLHVSALAEGLGLKQAIVSQQLRILRMSGLVEASRKDGYAVYTLTEPHLHDLIYCMERCCATQ